MANYRSLLPQLSGDLFLTDAGLETDLIFNHGIEIKEFAAHTLLPDAVGREALANYYRSFLRLACEKGAGFILDSQTWKAHIHWANDLSASGDELRAANRDSVAFIAGLREEFIGSLSIDKNMVAGLSSIAAEFENLESRNFTMVRY